MLTPPPLLLKLEKKFVRKYRGKMEYEYSVIHKDEVLTTRKSTCNYIGGYIENKNGKFTISFMFTNLTYLVTSTYKCPVMYAVAVFPELVNKVMERMSINVIQQ